MLVKIERFKGTSPRIAQHLLTPEMAQTATDAYLASGALRPFKGASLVTTTTKAGVKSALFLYEGQYWFHWVGADVNAVYGPVADDSWRRVYWTGEGAPKMTANNIATTGSNYPSNYYNLGIPAPANPPVATVTGTITDANPLLVESRAYVYTYVSAYGEEGPPSYPSDIVAVSPGQHCNLSALSTGPAGAYNIVKKNIYRTNTGSTTTEYQYVGYVPIATGTLSDTVAAEALGEVLPSATWLPPPATLTGLISLPNGSLAGIDGRQLRLSVPYQPHAWPLEYSVTMDSDTVAIGAFGYAVLVTTKGRPYIVNCADPANMSVEKMEIGQACVSKRSLVDMGYSILYASPDGLIQVGQGIFKNVTDGIMRKDDWWQGVAPWTLHAYLWNDKYVAFGERGAFIFDPATQDFVSLTARASTGYYDGTTGDLFLVDGDNILRWNSGIPLDYTWRSKLFTTPYAVNFGFAQVIADSYPVTAKIYADKVLKHTETVTDARHFRLPSGFLATQWEIELTGSNAINTVFLSQSSAELRQV